MFNFRKKKPFDPWAEFNKISVSSEEILQLSMTDAMRNYGTTDDAKLTIYILKKLEERISYLEGKIQMFNEFYKLEEKNG